MDKTADLDRMKPSSLKTLHVGNSWFQAMQNFAQRLPETLSSTLCALPLAMLLNSNIGTATAQEAGFVVHPENPVLRVGPAGAWDRAFLDPAAMIYHDGNFHSFYAGVPSWPHDLAIGHASSPDGVVWTRSGSDPVLTGAQADFETRSINSNSVIVTDEGQWMLYFSIATHTAFTGSIGRAVAPGPTGPWVIDPEPVLQPGPKGAWDHRGVGNASVVKSDDGYIMYYSGEGETAGEEYTTIHSMIGMAHSHDGKTWTKYNDESTGDSGFAESDPVMRGSDTGNSWAKDSITDPNVQKTNEGWAMVFRGDSKSVGYATSNDGVNWRQPFEGPVLKPRDAGVSELFFVSFVHHNDTDYIYFEGGSYTSANGYLVTRADQ